MARPTTYHPVEDQILLATAGEEFSRVNELLTEAGFKPRSPQAIRNRRARLLKGVNAPTTMADFADITRLEFQRRALLAQRDQLTEQVTSVNQNLEQVTELLRQVVAALGDGDGTHPPATPSSQPRG